MIKLTNYNNNNNNNRNKKNVIDNIGLTSTKDNRYCTYCHLKLVHKFNEDPTQKYIYSCPQCNVSAVNIYETEPDEKLRTTFPTQDPTRSSHYLNNKKFTFQADKDRLSRSEYFIVKNQRKKNEIEANDPYLADFILKNNKLTITNIEYYDPNIDE